MPWTLAHPAAVLPVYRYFPYPLSLAGLIVGSLAPDVGFHIGQYGLNQKAHSLAGALTVCVPVGLVLLVIAQLLYRPVSELLPQPHRQALHAAGPPFSRQSWHNIVALVISIYIGALTHIGWDSVTHTGGFFVTRIGLLRTTLWPGWSHDFQVCNILQYLSSLAGIGYLALSYAHHLRRTGYPSNSRRTNEKHRYVLLILYMVIAVSVALFYASQKFVHAPGLLVSYYFAKLTAIYATNTFVGLILCTVVVRVLLDRIKRFVPGRRDNATGAVSQPVSAAALRGVRCYLKRIRTAPPSNCRF